jgi:hypothetical protein
LADEIENTLVIRNFYFAFSMRIITINFILNPTPPLPPVKEAWLQIWRKSGPYVLICGHKKGTLKNA